MSYAANVLADSISPDGVRLLTVEVTFPRFILAEVNTHCMISRNSASSRAIPPERLIESVTNNPFVPETFNGRVKGMGVGEALDESKQQEARQLWIEAQRDAVETAYALIELDVDKSRINRLLEPFMWHTAILTATEWDNFFSLRCPPGDDLDIGFPAQPEFQLLTLEMRRVMRASQPRELQYGEWHLPLVQTTEIDEVLELSADAERPWERLAMISAGRCARSSYLTHHDPETMGQSLDRADGLKGNGHMSPFEHPARPIHPVADSENHEIDLEKVMLGRGGLPWGGKLRGWLPMRKLIPGEANFGATEGREPWDA